MKFDTLLTAFFFACLAVSQTTSLGAQESKGLLMTIYAPHPEQLVLALDEIELDWREDPASKGLKPAEFAAEVAGTRFVKSADQRAVFTVSGMTDVTDLLASAMSLKGANPGAEVRMVLYEPGVPRSEATRRLLTREVGLLLEHGEDIEGVLAGLAVGQLRAVPGVPGGYVVQAEHPIAALDLAGALRGRPGVRSAYPLLKRPYTTR